MTNELIGILGVLVLTSLLFVLRRCILPSERASKRRPVNLTAHREIHLLNKETAGDNAGLLWEPEVETRANPDHSHEQSRGRIEALRSDTHRADRTLGGEIR